MGGRKHLGPPQPVWVTRWRQRKRPGTITVWPRLLMGNSSLTPCRSARRIVCQMLRCICLSFSGSRAVVLGEHRPCRHTQGLPLQTGSPPITLPPLPPWCHSTPTHHCYHETDDC